MSSIQYRLVMAQLNPLVGDIAGNTSLITEAILRARDQLNAQCIVFPELVLTGYPPEDLLYRPSFIKDCSHAIQTIADACQGIVAIVGAPYEDDDGVLFNAALVLGEGCIKTIAKKQYLPNYSVFDEERYFTAGGESSLVELTEGLRVGITICEDIWSEYPVAAMQQAGANLIVNLNASPFHAGKHEQRKQTLRDRVSEAGVPIIYVNQTGGQDELVFDGSSFAIDSHGTVTVQAPAFIDDLYAVDIRSGAGHELQLTGETCEPLSDIALLYSALKCGVRDYVNKNGFSGAVLGLSGGIDSALTLAIAVDALGSDKVSAVMMPSVYTANISLEDAEAEADSLGVEYHVIPIAPAFEAFKEMLAGMFSNHKSDVTEENIQARCRGVVLMAISNKLGRIVLTTGNKSEMAVGYATLYGDMAGGFAPIKDVYKTKVYELCRYRNSLDKVIPDRVLERPPTAELAPDQLDQDSLPPYDVLDAILEKYIELDASTNDIISAGFLAEQVRDVLRKVDLNEYKRRQSPPGIKVTERAFGRDRRYPITSGFRSG